MTTREQLFEYYINEEDQGVLIVNCPLSLGDAKALYEWAAKVKEDNTGYEVKQRNVFTEELMTAILVRKRVRK